MEQLKDKKVKSLPLYLTQDIKNKVEEKASSLGMTVNGYIKMLINRDLEK